MLDSKIPSVSLNSQWEFFKNNCQILSPNNKQKHTILVVGTGLAGASAAASLGELGYKVKSFCLQDSPRRAHSVA
ncbi:MAG: hypothetical protein ACRDB1_09225, partial [Microcoleaceae cyanobacterium]